MWKFLAIIVIGISWFIWYDQTSFSQPDLIEANISNGCPDYEVFV